MATSLSILISDTRGCVISEDSRSLRYPVNLGKTSKSNHLVTAFSRFADPIVSLQRYQFAGDRIAGYWRSSCFLCFFAEETDSGGVRKEDESIQLSGALLERKLH